MAIEVKSAHHIESGTVLGGGRYIVVREINRGGLAVVYEAIDTANDGEGVALKCMSNHIVITHLYALFVSITGTININK